MKFDFEQQPGLYRWNRNLRTDGKPLISVITAFYNAGEYFEQTFNCVMDQTFPWFEWIIVNDGSNDKNSIELLENLAKKDNRIRVIHQKNAGAPSARNAGIDAAKTDYIFPLDSDDLIEPTCLEYGFWGLQFNMNAAWAYSDSVGFQGEEYLWEMPFNPERMKMQNHLTVTALIKKHAAKEVDGYSVQDFRYDEDWHFWLKLLAKGAFPVQIRGEHLFWYRRGETGIFASVHNNSISALRNKKIIEKASQFVIEPEKPVIYPVSKWKSFATPKESAWTECVFREHKKIHILFVIPWLSMGGADKFNLDLIAGLDKDRYEISIITTVQSDNAWIQRFRKETPEIFNLPNFLSPDNYPEFIDYFIKSREIDILFLSNSLCGYYLLPWLRERFPKLAIVDYVHMEEWYWRNGGYARTSGVMGSIVERTYVCNSATRDVLIDHFNRPAESVKTVHIGIDAAYFDRERVRAGLLYKELKIKDNRPIVLFICRLHPQKRPFLMLKIAQQVKKQIEDVAFVVIGDGPQAQDLIAAAGNMQLEDTVYFLGAKSEVRPYYRDAKLTLVCSMKEGLSLTAYESCAMGVPVVSADVGGQKDLIDASVGALIPCQQDEEKDFDARSFPNEEIESYSQAIVSILTDRQKWNSLSENCRKKVEQAFTINNMISELDNQFQQLVRDENLQITRKRKSDCLKEISSLTGELFEMHLLEISGGHSFVPMDDRFDTCGSSGVQQRLHDDGVILNRHEEVVNRHEQSINHQWEVQKWHEERLQRLEKWAPWGIMARIKRFIKIRILGRKE